MTDNDHSTDELTLTLSFDQDEYARYFRQVVTVRHIAIYALRRSFPLILLLAVVLHFAYRRWGACQYASLLFPIFPCVIYVLYWYPNRVWLKYYKTILGPRVVTVGANGVRTTLIGSGRVRNYKWSDFSEMRDSPEFLILRHTDGFRALCFPKRALEAPTQREQFQELVNQGFSASP